MGDSTLKSSPRTWRFAIISIKLCVLIISADKLFTGIPNFIRQPPNALDVNEGANLTLQVEMDGSPKPSADFKWSHLIGSSPINVPGVQLYPSVYSSVYPLNNIDASYCGRILETTIKNSVGSSSTTAATNVTVLLKLDKTFDLKAGKIAVSKCIGVEWNKAESGACYVKYEVAFSNASGYYVHSETGYNIDKMRICNLTAYSNITDVQLTVSFKATSKTVTAKVSETPITTPPPTPSGSDSNSGLIVGASVGGVVFLIIVIVIIVVCIKKSKRSKMDEDSCSPDYPLQEGQYAVASDVSRKPQEPTYADPNKATLIYGKLNENAGDRPRHTRKEDTSDYADVKVDERGYPAVGAMLTSYTDGYGERSRSRGDSGRDSGRRTAPERRPPPPYSDPDPHSTCLCTGE